MAIEDDYRREWVPIAAAAIMGGYVVLIQGCVTVSIALATTTFHWWIPVVGFGLSVLFGLFPLVLGFYIIGAVSSPSGRDWIGKKAMRREMIRQQLEDTNRDLAVEALGRFLLAGALIRVRAKERSEDVEEWFTTLHAYLLDAWGLHELGPMMAAYSYMSKSKMMKEAIDALHSLVERSSRTPLRDGFDPGQPSKWATYLEEQKAAYLKPSSGLQDSDAPQSETQEPASSPSPPTDTSSTGSQTLPSSGEDARD